MSLSWPSSDQSMIHACRKMGPRKCTYIFILVPIDKYEYFWCALSNVVVLNEFERTSYIKYIGSNTVLEEFRLQARTARRKRINCYRTRINF